MNGKTITLEAVGNETVESLKNKISEQESIAPHFFRLVARGRPLDPSKNLDHYHISKESTVHMAVKLSGASRTESITMVINVAFQQQAATMVYQILLDNPSTTTTFEFIRKATGEKGNLPSANYVLCGYRASRAELTDEVWISEPLDERMTISEHGISDGHWLILRPRTTLESSINLDITGVL